MRVYLDNAATTPIDQEVLDVMTQTMASHYGNPSSTHLLGRKSKSLIETARKNIAKHLNCTPGELVFTSGGTEADNMAINCSVNHLGVRHIITSKLEHHAVGHTADNICDGKSVKLSCVNLDEKGHIDLQHLEELLAGNSEKTLVSLMYANNEIGNLLPAEEVSNLCRKYKAYFHSDTVQSMAHYEYDLDQFEVDFITCAAHKFHGPKGVGFLYINKDVKISPMIFGGAQERNMRGGTENLHGIVAMSKAFDVAYRDLEAHRNHIEGLKQYMIDQLKAKLDDVRFNGDSANLDRSLYTVLSTSLPKTEHSAMLLFHLDILGICCSGGSACSSGSNKGSHVLEGINADMERPAVRFSFSKYNTKEEIDYAVGQLVELYS
ncbi:MAG: cysteine desulfurase family protein [Flavobacteriales bacterium]